MQHSIKDLFHSIRLAVKTSREHRLQIKEQER